MTSVAPSEGWPQGTEFPSDRWARLAEPLGIDPRGPLVLALSGGADSVYLLHLVAAARPRPGILAVHVEHGLRGRESDADAQACAAACARLDVRFELRRARLDAAPNGLEARAREARYAQLAAAARAAGSTVLLTAHQADDALETLILRWLRGADLAGLDALRPRRALAAELRPDELGGVRRGPRGSEAAALVVVRPLLALRRAQIRASLARAGIAWREDSSNLDPRFARNALRTEFLPALSASCGAGAIEDLFAFQRAVAGLEAALAAGTHALRVAPPLHAAARRSARDTRLGGSVARGAIASLPRPLARRALARLLAAETGALPRRAVLDGLVDDLFCGRTGWREVRGGWRLQLRGDRLDVEPPPEPASDPQVAPPLSTTGALRTLSLPGVVDLGDGRRITAARVGCAPGSPFPTGALQVELDAHGLPDALGVRAPRPGDRFHPLGAPGSKPLARFLADVGLPRHDRARIPLVVAGAEILWVAGVRPSDARRVRPRTRERLRLTLQLDDARARAR